MAVYQQTNASGDTRWIIDFIWVDPSSGVSRRVRRVARDAKGRFARSQTAAERAEHVIRASLAAGTFELAARRTEVRSLTLAEYFETKYLADARVRLKPQTVDYLVRTFRSSLLPVLGTKQLAEIDATAVAEVTRTLHARELSAKTINNALSALRATLSHASEHGDLATVPRVRWQRVPPTSFDFFTFEEAARLIKYAPPMVVVALRTGMRIGELLALRWSDVSLERKQVTVSRSVWWETGGAKHEGAPKNHRARTIPLSDDAQAVLAELGGVPSRVPRAGQAYVFVDDAGLPLTPGACKWPLWRAQDAARLRRTGPHVLRHTFASHLAMRGVPLPAVQALMGHSTIQMTMKYAHLAPDHLRSAIAALGSSNEGGK